MDPATEPAISSAFASFETLTFDCYGTLIDWELGLASELRAWAARRGVTTGEDELVALVGELETGVEREHPTELYPDVLARVLAQIGRRFGIDVSAEEAAAFGGSVPRWPAFADSPDALARLARRFRLVVLSNVDRESFAASNERLNVRFDLVVTAEDVGAYKPEAFPEMLRRVAAAGIDTSTVLHIAQSLYHDHGPAAASGIPAVWIDRRQGRHGAGATPPPPVPVQPRWTYPSMAAFADAAGC